MKDWSKFLEEDPKKPQAAAFDMESSKEMNPPDFNLTSENSKSEQPIQGFFPDISKAPAGPAPVPIPYPNIPKSSQGDQNSKGDGLMSNIGTGISSLAHGAQDLVSDASTKISGIAKSFGGQASAYISAVHFGKQMFKLQAGFKNLNIMGISAIGTPGCLDGPQIGNHIKNAPSVAGMQGEEKSMRNAIAEGVSSNFDSWRRNVMVPGLPWYPAFAAFPGPVAPPMPNVPTPLISCPSSQMAKITVASKLKKSIYNFLPSDMQTPENEAFVEGIAAQLAIQFLIWLTSQMVTNVLGKGPVPTFAPPYVPVGPVIGGDNIGVPGHLMS